MTQLNRRGRLGMLKFLLFSMILFYSGNSSAFGLQDCNSVLDCLKKGYETKNVAYYEKACNLYYSSLGCHKVGDFFIGSNNDLKAFEYYKKACKLGLYPSCKVLTSPKVLPRWFKMNKN